MADVVLDMSNDALRNATSKRVSELRGLYRFQVTRYRPRRSDKQNAYLWGVVYPYVAQGIHDQWGDTITSDEAHIFCKGRFLSRPIVNRETGQEMGVAFPSTTKLTTTEFKEYIEKIARFAAESLGVVIPAPGDIE